jgi:hypothetical protein
MSETRRFNSEAPTFAHASSPSKGEKQCQSRAKKKQRTDGESVETSLQTLFGTSTPTSGGLRGSSPSIAQTSSSTIRGRDLTKRLQSPSALAFEDFELAAQGPPSSVSPPMKQLKRSAAPQHVAAGGQKQRNPYERKRHHATGNSSAKVPRRKWVENYSTYEKGSSKMGTLDRRGVQEEGAPGENVNSDRLLPRMREEHCIHVTNKFANRVQKIRLSSSKGVEAATTSNQAETKSYAQGMSSKAATTTDQVCSAQAEAGEVLVLQRRNTPRKARPSAEAKWTEAVVPAQILLSEMQQRLLELKKDGKRVAPEVDRALDMWHENVAKRLVVQNQLVLQNIEAVHQEKLVRRHADSARGELLCAKASVRRLQEELRQLKSKVEEKKAWNADRQVASRFLHALDRLRR